MSDVPVQEFWVARDVDRLGEYLGNSTSDFFFKVSTEDSHGTLLVIELTNHARGGVPRHMHYDQDEWFYVVEGEYIIEVGRERFRLKPGDSAFGPRKVPHVWAFVGDGVGRLLGTITPAGQLEAFFRATARDRAPLPLDTALLRAYGFELVRPPLAID
jgi:mannose-6-phosphate isomerase-like protein (cupin superfamily)